MKVRNEKTWNATYRALDVAVEEGDHVSSKTFAKIMGLSEESVKMNENFLDKIDKVEKTGKGEFTIKLKGKIDKIQGEFSKVKIIDGKKIIQKAELRIENGAKIKINLRKDGVIELEYQKIQGKKLIWMDVPTTKYKIDS